MTNPKHEHTPLTLKSSHLRQECACGAYRYADTGTHNREWLGWDPWEEPTNPKPEYGWLCDAELLGARAAARALRTPENGEDPEFAPALAAIRAHGVPVVEVDNQDGFPAWVAVIPGPVGGLGHEVYFLNPRDNHAVSFYADDNAREALSKALTAPLKGK